MPIRLEITTGVGTPLFVEHAGPAVRIGRAPGSEVRFDGEAARVVSWEHARIDLTPAGPVLCDLGSLNGTFVNGRRIDAPCPLREGDLARLGQAGPALKVVALEAAPPAPEAATPPPTTARALSRQQKWLLAGGAVTACVLAVLVAAAWRAAPRGSGSPQNGGGEGEADVLASDAEARLADRARAVLQKYCHRCHGKDGSSEGGISYILSRDLLVSRQKVVPHEPGQSKLLRRVADADDPMPPEGHPRPSEDEVAALRRWVEAGAPPFAPGRFLRHHDVLQAIRDHLRGVPAADRPYQRYFTFTHIANNPGRRASLAVVQAALTKLLNSLSWRQELLFPTPVGADGAVVHIDIRDLQWDRHGRWDAVLREYPYAMRLDRAGDAELRRLAQDVAALTGTPHSHVRADWFVAAAARPPLYHALLGLPSTGRELEERLGVDAAGNFARSVLRRSGFLKSGVSSQNRLVERHPTRYGAYWKSYDFQVNSGRGDLLRFPLGPAFPGNPFPEEAFAHDGGEIIFNLPNGLQGYLLVDHRDARIDVAPVAVVRDAKESAGTVQIVNGLSCMACHQNGVIRDGVRDVIRASRSVRPAAQQKVEALYPHPEDLDRLLAEDEQRFVQAVNQVIRRHIAPGRTEPIGAAVKPYLKRPLSLLDAACELGVEDPDTLRQAIQRSRLLREQLGLGALIQGKAIKRQAWEAREEGGSAYQKAAEELGLQ